MNDKGRWMIWPERRFVPAAEIVEWANDRVADGMVGDEPEYNGTLDEAVRVLEYIGSATFAKQSVVPPETSTDALRRLGFDE